MDAPPDSEVTGALLRELAPLRIMRWALTHTFTIKLKLANSFLLYFLDPEWHERNRQLEGDEDPADPKPTLDDAALIYKLAGIVRESPAKAVAETLDLQTRTATNWIKRARERGLLD